MYNFFAAKNVIIKLVCHKNIEVITKTDYLIIIK